MRPPPTHPLDVGVITPDEGVLAPELQNHRRQCLCRRRHHLLAHAGGADKDDLVGTWGEGQAGYPSAPAESQSPMARTQQPFPPSLPSSLPPSNISPFPLTSGHDGVAGLPVPCHDLHQVWGCTGRCQGRGDDAAVVAGGPGGMLRDLQGGRGGMRGKTEKTEITHKQGCTASPW